MSDLFSEDEMRIPIYQIDAFTSKVFAGNPAAVCPLESWLEDPVLQAIAAENNLSETAFFVREGERYRLRWFTPSVEVDLCGHATLASAYVVFHFLQPSASSVSFLTKSGVLVVERTGDRLTMKLPRRPATPCNSPRALLEGLGLAPREVLRSRDYMAVYDSERDVRSLRPEMQRLIELDAVGIIATAKAESPGVDFVSRFFAPSAGIPEDPVTGSAHCTLVPYWAQKLGKSRLHALQVSARGGELFCEDGPDSVSIAGHAVKYLEGAIHLY